MSGEGEGGPSERDLSEFTQEKIKEGILDAEDWANHSKDPGSKSATKINLSDTEVDQKFHQLTQDLSSAGSERDEQLEFDLDGAVEDTKALKKKLLQQARNEEQELEARMSANDPMPPELAEAVRITKDAAGDQVIRQAAEYVIKESRRKEAPVTKLPDRTPDDEIELPTPKYVTLQDVLDENLHDLGDTPEDIKNAMESATTPEAFASLLPVLGAQIMEALHLDEKHNDNPATIALKAQAEAALQVLTDPDRKRIKRKRGTGEDVVEVTTTHDGTQLPEVVGDKKPGEAYVTFTPTRLENATMFSKIFELDARTLAHARTAAETLASGKEIEIDPDMPSAYEDPRVKALTEYLYDTMLTKLDEAEEILTKNPEWVKSQFGLTDEQLGAMKLEVQKLLEYYNGLYAKIPDYDEPAEDYDEED